MIINYKCWKYMYISSICQTFKAGSSKCRNEIHALYPTWFSTFTPKCILHKIAPLMRLSLIHGTILNLAWYKQIVYSRLFLSSDSSGIIGFVGIFFLRSRFYSQPCCHHISCSQQKLFAATKLCSCWLKTSIIYS